MPRSPSPRDTANSGARSLVTNYGRYETPEKLAADARLSPAVRVRLLNEWAEDLTARLRASDENMTGEDPGRAGEWLRRVHVCLEKITPPATSH